MRRILIVLTVALLMAAMVVFATATAIAVQPHHGCDKKGETCFHKDVPPN